MSKQITPFSISAPGFSGLNLQDSPVELSYNYALIANNCVIDRSGRIASRKGWTKLTPTNAALGTSDLTCVCELTQNNGTNTILGTGNNKLFKYDGVNLVELTYGGGGVAPTITDDNWSFCQINGIAIFSQIDHDTLIYDPVVSTTTYRRLKEKVGFAGTFYTCDIGLSAFGRLWVARTTLDKNTVVFSDLLTPQVMTGGSAGSLNLLGVWPNGGDEIVALGAHNNFLVIFGKRQTLIYSGANTPSTMVLHDHINIGCIARDSVQTTDSDILFLSNKGVMSLMRTIQEKSAPLRDISRNVKDELQAHIQNDVMANVKSVYSTKHGFYLLTMPYSNEVYCFDMTRPATDGSSKTTLWTLVPKGMYESKDGVLYFGMAGYLGSYSGYLDDTSIYRMSYFTTWIDFGNPIQKSILKKAIVTLIGGTNQPIVVKWAYDFSADYFSETTALTSFVPTSEFGVAEYGIGEYGSGVSVNLLSINGTSSGTVLQFGFETDVNDVSISVQKIDLFTKDGRL